jgi:hypothetical protein
MRFPRVVARLFGNGQSGDQSDANSTASEDDANCLDSGNGAHGTSSRSFRLKNAIRGVCVTVALVANGGNALMFFEHVHDSGGICSFDIVRDSEILDGFLCPSSTIKQSSNDGRFSEFRK